MRTPSEQAGPSPRPPRTALATSAQSRDPMLLIADKARPLLRDRRLAFRRAGTTTRGRFAGFFEAGSRAGPAGFPLVGVPRDGAD